MTIDDFEWVEHGFDTWYFQHKVRDFTVARLQSFNGWNVIVSGVYTTSDPLVVDSFDAAKALATLTVANNMERIPDATNFRPRALRAGPKTIPAGVFQMDKLRR